MLITALDYKSDTQLQSEALHHTPLPLRRQYCPIKWTHSFIVLKILASLFTKNIHITCFLKMPKRSKLRIFQKYIFLPVVPKTCKLLILILQLDPHWYLIGRSYLVMRVLCALKIEKAQNSGERGRGFWVPEQHELHSKILPPPPHQKYLGTVQWLWHPKGGPSTWRMRVCATKEVSSELSYKKANGIRGG